MKEFLYVWINKKRYQLYRYTTDEWRLVSTVDRKRLNVNEAHDLDFWRRKGVLESEEEEKG